MVCLPRPGFVTRSMSNTSLLLALLAAPTQTRTADRASSSLRWQQHMAAAERCRRCRSSSGSGWPCLCPGARVGRTELQPEPEPEREREREPEPERDPHTSTIERVERSSTSTSWSRGSWGSAERARLTAATAPPGSAERARLTAAAAGCSGRWRRPRCSSRPRRASTRSSPTCGSTAPPAAPPPSRSRSRSLPSLRPHRRTRLLEWSSSSPR
eukprot:COSAG04_NODE_10289_length_789_cov_9.200000_1_plen_212_part_10